VNLWERASVAVPVYRMAKYETTPKKRTEQIIVSGLTKPSRTIKAKRENKSEEIAIEYPIILIIAEHPCVIS
jgi:hypothetical protein